MSRAGALPAAARRGSTERVDLQDDYVKHLISYVDRAGLKPLTIVSNAGLSMGRLSEGRNRQRLRDSGRTASRLRQRRSCT